MKYRKCLVGVDFSEASLKALEAAFQLAEKYQIELHVVHVVEEQAAAALAKYMVINDTELLKHMELRLTEVVHKNLGEQVNPRIFIQIGHPYVNIVELCTQEGIDLLVMGAETASNHSCKVGPIAAKCIRKGPADVLLVRQDAALPFRKVLACIDLSPTSARVVEIAREFSQSSEAKLAYLMVYQTPLALTVDYAGFVPAIPMDQEEDCARCEMDLRQFVKDCSDNIVVSEEKFLIKSALQVKDGIISAIQDEDIDLVCLGTKGQNTMKTLFLGTTAERVISHACCSILAVKPLHCASQVPESVKYSSEIGLPPSNLRVC